MTVTGTGVAASLRVGSGVEQAAAITARARPAAATTGILMASITSTGAFEHRATDEHVNKSHRVLQLGFQHRLGGAQDIVHRRQARLVAVPDDALAFPGLQLGGAADFSRARAPSTRARAVRISTRTADSTLWRSAWTRSSAAADSANGRRPPDRKTGSTDKGADAPGSGLVGERRAVELQAALDADLRQERRPAGPPGLPGQGLPGWPPSTRPRAG